MLIRTLTVLSFAAAVYAIPIVLDKNGYPEFVPDKTTTTPAVTTKNPTADFASSVQAETVLPELQKDTSFETDFPGFGLETVAKSVTDPTTESALESDFSGFGLKASEPASKSVTAPTTESVDDALESDFPAFGLKTSGSASKSATAPIKASVDDSLESDFPVVPAKSVTGPTKAPTTPPANVNMVDIEKLVNKLVSESEAVLGDIDNIPHSNPPTASIPKPTRNPDCNKCNKPACTHHKPKVPTSNLEDSRVVPPSTNADERPFPVVPPLSHIWTSPAKAVKLQVGVHGICNAASDCGAGECCSDFGRCGTTEDHCTSRNPLSAGLNIPRPRILNDPFATPPLSEKTVVPITSTTKGGNIVPPVGFAQDQPKPVAKDCHCSKKPAAVNPLSAPTPSVSPVSNPSAFPEDVSRLSNPPGSPEAVSRLSIPPASPFISAPVSNPRSLTSPGAPPFADDVFAESTGISPPILPAVTPKKTECERTGQPN